MVLTRNCSDVLVQLDGSAAILTGLGAESKADEDYDSEDVLSEVHGAQEDVC